MAVLLSASEITKSFGSRTIFNKITFAVESNQRIGLIGPNGAGKSTLLQLLAKLQTVDEGTLSSARNLRLGYLHQSPSFAKDETVFETILGASEDPTEWDNMNFAYELISKLELDQNAAGADQMVSSLSGGWRKRVALARELIKKPNLLLLDEHTNHLDIHSILWLENFLQSQTDMAVIMVTHDRLFLQRTCDHIFDLDQRNPDGLIKFHGVYADFLEFKASVISTLKQQEEVESNKLRRETEWLRRGPQARLKKQTARIDRAGELAEKVDDLSRRNQDRKVGIDFGDVGRTPKKVVEVEKISKKYGEHVLLKNFSFIRGAKARVGLIGRNGCGKSTLIRILLGLENADEGKVSLSDKISYSYFEQHRESLNPNTTLLRAVCPDGDYVHLQGQAVYAKSYLHRFLFRSEQMDMPVHKLSGGEQSRLLIARLMLTSNPLLILDEPTNDLDVATLNILEEALAQFPGAIILVTHDRYFMDQVANKILAFTEQDGQILDFADTYQWEQWFQVHGQNIKSKRPGAPAVATAGTSLADSAVEKSTAPASTKIPSCEWP